MSLKPGIDDGLAQRLEAATSSVMLSSTRKIAWAPRAPRVGDVGEHAVDRIRVKVAAAHLDDRAEAAVEGAAPRRFDDVDLAAEQRVAAEHARARGSGSRSGVDASRLTGRSALCAKPSGAAVREARRSPPTLAAALERAQQLAERLLAFAADDEVDVRRSAS